MRFTASLRDRLHEEKGAALILAAIVLLFIFGMMALALDGGRGMDERRSVQNAADHAAIAGAWAKCHGQDPVAAGEAFATANGYSPGELTLDPNYGPNSVEAIINTSIDGKISPVLGVDQIGVRNRAVATCYLQPGGGGDLPFGAPGGGVFDGTMQVNNPCSAGNCRPLKIPRSDSNGTANWIIRNISLGVEPDLAIHWDDPSGTYSVCQPGDPVCHILETDTGVSAAHLSDGLVRGSNSAAVDGRLENLGPASLNYGRTFFTPKDRELDGDYWYYILNDASTAPTSYPTNPSNTTTIYGLANIAQAVTDGVIPDPATWRSPWMPEVHGDLLTTNDPQNRHIYYDGEVYKCDSPRRAQLPIVTDDLGFVPTIGVTPPLDPNGNKDVKVLEFYDVIIDSPLYDTNLNNADVIKTTSAYIIWYGPNASCENGWPVEEPVPDQYIVTLDE